MMEYLNISLVGSAHLFGLQHFKTFDGKHYEFVGPCTYLLSRDLVTRNYTLAVQYASSRGKPYAAVLKLVLDEVQWDLDLANQTVRMAGVGQTLPASHGLTSAHYEAGKFVIESRARGVRLECIASYEACTFTVSGSEAHFRRLIAEIEPFSRQAGTTIRWAACSGQWITNRRTT